MGHAREDRDVEDADGDDGVDRAGAEDRRDHDGESSAGKAKTKSFSRMIASSTSAAPRRRQQAERHADAHADADGDERHGDRVARADA